MADHDEGMPEHPYGGPPATEQFGPPQQATGYINAGADRDAG